MDKLRKIYKNQKEKVECTNGILSTWLNYKEMDAIFGTNPKTACVPRVDAHLTLE
jgi:hypothetical protein